MLGTVSTGIWMEPQPPPTAEEMEIDLELKVDNDRYYDREDLLEREMLRPKLLRDFGWQVAHVLAKDWYDEPQQVLTKLLNRLQ
jgi:hypothetical protein